MEQQLKGGVTPRTWYREHAHPVLLPLDEEETHLLRSLVGAARQLNHHVILIHHALDGPESKELDDLAGSLQGTISLNINFLIHLYPPWYFFRCPKNSHFRWNSNSRGSRTSKEVGYNSQHFEAMYRCLQANFVREISRYSMRCSWQIEPKYLRCGIVTWKVPPRGRFIVFHN